MTNTNRPLKRIPSEGQIAGVCAGLAEYFELDVTLMRVIFVVLAFITGGGMILLYIILALVLPVSGSSYAGEDFSKKAHDLGSDLHKSKGVYYLRNYLGFGLLVFGVWLLLVQFFPQWIVFRWDFVWPVILIFVGFLIIIRKK